MSLMLRANPIQAAIFYSHKSSKQHAKGPFFSDTGEEAMEQVLEAAQ